jgi:hypothetical protein
MGAVSEKYDDFGPGFIPVALGCCRLQQGGAWQSVRRSRSRPVARRSFRPGAARTDDGDHRPPGSPGWCRHHAA